MTYAADAPHAGRHLTSFTVVSLVLWAMTFVLVTSAAGFALLPFVLAVVVTGWTIVVASARWKLRSATRS